LKPKFGDRYIGNKFERLILALLASAAWLAVPAIAEAGPLDCDTRPTPDCLPRPVGFTFVNASADFNGVTERISGIFGIDAATGFQSLVEVELTGPAPYAGSCFASDEFADARTVYGNCAQLYGNFNFQTQFHFANDLLPGTADPLDAVINPNFAITNVTGFAVNGVPAPAVSEPGTIGLLVSGLLGLLVMRRRDVRSRWGG
jgi:hypothetical protein